MLHLVSRLVGRHQLHLLNLYPFILKYLVPTQQEVTKFLAALVEACHHQVPPDELRPIVLHIIKYFVTEAQAPEVMEVGLNAIREIAARTVNILNEDELADLANFRKFKHKGVTMAARSLINAYRELHPQLLHRSLRGKEATMALSRGEVHEKQFGELQASETIEGLELLAAKASGLSKVAAKDGPLAKEVAEREAQQMMSSQVLSSDDFKQLRKLRLQKSIEMQLGRKRKHEELSSSSDSEGSDSGSGEENDDERGLAGRLPDQMSGDMLKATPKKGRTKAERLARVKAGRTDFKEKILERAKSRKGGKTNKEQARNKPLFMTLRSEAVQKKKARTAKDRLHTLRSHIKTLRKNGNHPKRRR